MSSLDGIKRRAARRRGQAGAAMFVVAMTLAALASVGIYALAAAAMEVRTSGNERQNTQTHYLTEYAIIGTAYELTASKAQWYLGQMMAQPDTPCLSLPNVPTSADKLTRACWRLQSTEIGVSQSGAAWSGTITDAYAGVAAFQPNTAPGSLGPIPLNGDFFVELTEPTQSVSPPGYDLNQHLCFLEFTATGNGITKPVFANSTDLTTGFGGEGVETQRARLVAGPIPCPH